ncbi:MAG: cache domain-containing protein, partial [Magnetococcales bacterium]|nr:cache domain-containing protein [Magnetococcales bacterium]
MSAWHLRRRTGLGIGPKMVLWFLAVALLPLGGLSWHSYRDNFRHLTQEIDNKIHGDITQKKSFTERQFRNYYQILELQSQSEENKRLLRELREAFMASGQTAPRFVKGFRWAEITDRLSIDLDKMQQTFDYLNIHLIDHEGNILFSTLESDLLGNNLRTPPLATSHLGIVARNALAGGGALFSDIGDLPWAGSEPSLFMARSLVDDSGGMIGLIVFQLCLEEFLEFMQESGGLGEMGETFIVDPGDWTMRSNSRFSGMSTLLRRKMNPEAIQAWTGSGNGTAFYTNHDGRRVIGRLEPLDTIRRYGLDWALVAEIDAGEAFLPIDDLRR